MVLPGTAIEFDKRYKVISIIGRGRETVVYRAESIEGDKKEVAIKVLSGKNHADLLLSRLKHEATMLLLAEHPRVISIFGMHAIKDYIYLALEYAPMGDLFRLTNYGSTPLPNPQAQMFFIQCLEGLAHLEKVGIIHRDIKPDNILVTGFDSVKIGDFGVASMTAPNNQRRDLHLAVGAISYLAPEILDGQVCDFQSDLYALALSFYHIISGTHPFDDAPLVEQKARRESLDIPNLGAIAPNCPPKVTKAIMKMLSYSRENRYPSAIDVLNDLRGNTRDRPAPNQRPLPAISRPTGQNVVANGPFEYRFGSNPDDDADSLVETTVIKVPIHRIASLVTKPSVEIRSSLQENNLDKTCVINNQRLEKYPKMARETDKQDRDAEATQSIPKDMLDKFRIGGLPARSPEEKKTQTAKKNSTKFSIPQTRPIAVQSQRKGLSRIVLAIITCVVVALGIIGFYIVYPASELVLTIVRDGVNTSLQNIGIFSSTAQPSTDPVPPEPKSTGLKTDSTRFGPSDDETKSSNIPNPNVDVTAKNPPPENSITAVPQDEAIAVAEKKELAEDTKPAGVTEPEEVPDGVLVFKGGVHSGVITGLFPQGPTHVSFIPLPDSTDIVIIVGLEGWTPRRGEMVSENTIKVSSNGIVLQFKGLSKDKARIAGRVEDLVSGSKGSWEVEALSKD